MAIDNKEINRKEVKAQMKVTSRKSDKAKKKTENIDNESDIFITPTMIAEKNKYEEKIVRMIVELEAKIVKLNGETQHMKDQAKEKFGYQIESLTRIKEGLEHSLYEIEESTADKWHYLKQTAEEKIAAFEGETKNMFDGIKVGFSYLLSKFRNK